VCYFDSGKAILKHAGWDGSQWQIENVSNGYGGDCSIALDAGGGIHIAYVDYYRRLIYAGKPSASSAHKLFLPLVIRPG
jgi:hypothetical protein